MSLLERIPFNFVYENYFVLEYNKEHYDFRFKKRQRYLELYDGSVSEYLDEFLNDATKREYKIAVKVRDNADRICNLYEILYQENDVPLEFYKAVASERIYTSQSCRYMPYYLVDKNCAETPVLKGEDSDCLISTGKCSSLANRLSECNYSIAHERGCNFLSRLATSWPSIKKLYSLFQKSFSGNDDDILLALRKFIDEFIKYKSEYDNIPYLIGTEKGANPLRAKSFERMYKYQVNVRPYNVGDLSVAMKCSEQNVRTYIVEYFQLCRDIVALLRELGGSYVLLIDFFTQLDRLITEKNVLIISENPSLFDVYKRLDEYSKRFLCDLIQIKEVVVPCCNDVILFKSTESIRVVRSNVMKALELFEKNPLPFDLDFDLELILGKSNLNEVSRSMIREIVCHSKMFEFANDGKKKQLKYAYLSTNDVRFARILWDNEEHCMSKQDILLEYQKRAKLLGEEINCDLNDIPLKKTEYMESIGKIGIWKLIDFSMPLETTSKGILKAIQKYVTQINRPFTYEEMRCELKNFGFDLYSERTIREYVKTYASLKDGFFIPKI